MMDLRNIFGYHPVGKDDAVKQMHADIRIAAQRLAETIENTVPECYERSVAIERCREAMYWANAGIAINLSPLDYGG